MIEYPEIVCMRNQMRQALLGKRIKQVFVEDGREYAGTVRQTLLTQLPETFQRRLEGGILVGIDNVSQTLLLATDTRHTLSLGAIYGSIRFHPTEETLPSRKPPCLQLTFSDDAYLTVVVSLFGEIRVFDETERAAYLSARDPRLVTPDSKRFTLEGFGAALVEGRMAKVSAKRFLTSRMPVYYLDGLGGGYVQEILYRSRIHPRRKVSSLSSDEQEAYYRSIREVVAEAIERGGRYNEHDLSGRNGSFVPHVRKETLGQPCQECGTAIERFRFEGGYCYVCPQCQPLSNG